MYFFADRDLCDTVPAKPKAPEVAKKSTVPKATSATVSQSASVYSTRKGGLKPVQTPDPRPCLFMHCCKWESSNGGRTFLEMFHN